MLTALALLLLGLVYLGALQRVTRAKRFWVHGLFLFLVLIVTAHVVLFLPVVWDAQSFQGELVDTWRDMTLTPRENTLLVRAFCQTESDNNSRHSGGYFWVSGYGVRVIAQRGRFIRRSIAIEDIPLGAVVTVWYRGMVLESEPALIYGAVFIRVTP